ncbi:hypothetical protein TNIN_151571 [Trichonephila inaurata madagascariensis]|uniref:Uncharacterized protein n=1 Tax=Trichonephila inaurata madagascariensis TaxID=2747483 RepID=A0A8X6Y4F2_9ARAC|nr:hypothetical protein TNIN_151571 [Trichonephila inaurata madagascariensis]
MGIRSTWRMKGRVRLTSKSLSTSHSKATPEPVTTREGTKKRERDRKKQGACDCFQTAHNTNSHARYVENLEARRGSESLREGGSGNSFRVLRISISYVQETRSLFLHHFSAIKKS